MIHSQTNRKWCFSNYLTLTSTTVTKTMCIAQLILNSQDVRYVRYFNGKVLYGRPKHNHIHPQRLQINKSFCFFFYFLKLRVWRFSVIFGGQFLDRKYKPRKLVWNPVQSSELEIRMCQFEEKFTNSKDVPHLKTTITAVMSSF